MDLTPATASAYVHRAFDEMLAVAERLGDDRVNQRPISRHTNAVAGLIRHCCGMAEFWLGHVGVGRDSHRDRDAEFSGTATVAELRAMVSAALQQIDADLVALEAGASSPYEEGRIFLSTGDQSDASLVVHVIEELFQHLGHCEIAADALTAG
jgi:uncharacterized damage-inducible protein DinB